MSAFLKLETENHKKCSEGIDDSIKIVPQCVFNKCIYNSRITFYYFLFFFLAIKIHANEYVY